MRSPESHHINEIQLYRPPCPKCGAPTFFVECKECRRRDALEYYFTKALEFEGLAKTLPGRVLRTRYAELAKVYRRLAKELAED